MTAKLLMTVMYHDKVVATRRWAIVPRRGDTVMIGVEGEPRDVYVAEVSWTLGTDEDPEPSVVILLQDIRPKG
ncbi:hypothetical protein [Zavarzinia sp. CC-PAN008]|uniref:hypothetical protein n=1 Tax=Zavarzinia sp. CC-PAN008 TaxID=3243332 RepID=UPI003F742B89